MFPSRDDIWRDNAIPMQEYILNLVNIISKYEPVFLFCEKKNLNKINNIASDVKVVECDFDDIWARDIGPTFIRKNKSVECIDWKFNAWGGKDEGAYFPWDNDNRFASFVAKYFNIPITKSNLILEGGGIMPDGNGTIFSTKSVLLNKNRNPNWSQTEIENEILRLTGDIRIVWLDSGLANDETNGHIDNMISFVNSTELCLAWTDDIHNPNYESVHSAYNILSKVTNCYGEKYKINLIPLPPLQYMSQSESDGLSTNDNAMERLTGDILPASYLNYYLINNAVLIPTFGCETDNEVRLIFEKIFKNKEIISIYSREPLLGGGGMHCLLHEIYR